LCGVVEEGTAYVSPNKYATIQRIPTASLCCEKCQADINCGAWTLDTATQLCSLMGREPDFSVPTAVRQPNAVAGLPHRALAPRGTLYCVALMQPGSYEIGLLQMQVGLKISMFACEESKVYSNTEIELVPGLRTGVIESDLRCGMGGDSGTALNTGIFIAFWKSVIDDGRFRFNEWTVKVDPDAVFFPDRLKAHLQLHADGPAGVYLNNCKYGLHGPIEVFSTKAMETYAAHYQQCQQKLWFAASHWGEDMYMDQCLQKVLKVKRDDEFSLICEDHCDCPTFRACNTGAVTFHPFKTQAGYRQCMASAGVALPA